MFAVGGNVERRTARTASTLSVTLVLAYTWSSFCASLAGVMVTARSASALRPSARLRAGRHRGGHGRRVSPWTGRASVRSSAASAASLVLGVIKQRPSDHRRFAVSAEDHQGAISRHRRCVRYEKDGCRKK
jgi:hypothetical protein